MAKLFFSYSHADEAMRDRLEKHLSLLQHQGLIETWHDRRILAGDEIDSAIDSNLEQSHIILLLVSADFIASRYCFSIEMKRALQLHTEGKARVIPVILDDCDWHSAPFGHLLAAPKDGKPVTAWARESEAWTDVARMVRKVIESMQGEKVVASEGFAAAAARPAARPAAQAGMLGGVVDGSGFFAASTPEHLQVPRSSNLRLKKEFSDFEKDQFLDEGFEFVAKFFDASMKELEARNAGIQCRFQRLDARSFAAFVYRAGKSVAECSVRIGGMGGRSRMLSFSYDGSAPANTSNEMLHVEADDQGLYYKGFMSPFSGRGSEQMSQQGASEHLWRLFIERLQ